ncbi:MAG: FAD-dependent oxidoreductase [Burkholderiales bacterium]
MLIAGAGIAGLTAALALAERGFEVTVLERRAEPADTGTGISLFANGTRLLEGLGLGPALARFGHDLGDVEWRTGRRGLRIAVSAAHGREGPHIGPPSLNLLRRDLHGALLEAALAHPGVRLLAGRTVSAIEEDAAGVTVVTAEGERHRGSVAVGADGIHSRVRTLLLGEDAGPRHAGEIAWRAMVRSDSLPPKERLRHRFVFWLGADRHVLAYPMGGPDAPWINVAAFVKVPAPPEVSWTLEGDPDAMRAAFDGWEPRLRRLLAGVDRCFLLSLHQHPPPKVWSRGRVALLGDACHAMLPHAGQGAGMGIEDAVVLAGALARQRDDPVAAFAAYGARRGPRVARVMGTVQALGAQYRIPNPIRRTAFHVTLRLLTWAKPDAIRRRNAWLYGHDAASSEAATSASAATVLGSGAA